MAASDSFAEQFQGTAFCGGCVPFDILGIGSLKSVLVQDNAAFLRVDGFTGKPAQGIHGCKDRGAVCAYCHQEAFAGHQVPVGAEEGTAFYVYGVVPVAFSCF